MVTSQKIYENIMDYRGSKSNRVNLFVKEQRVDGSYHKSTARYSFVIKVYSNGSRKRLSNQNPFLVNKLIRGYYSWENVFNARYFSIIISPYISRKFSSNGSNYVSNKLHGNLVAGIVDAEGCFNISVTKNRGFKGDALNPSIYTERDWSSSPLSVRLYFAIKLHLKDKNVLEMIVATIGVGSIYIDEGGEHPTASLRDASQDGIKKMAAIIEFFDRYPLVTQKLADYFLFKEVFLLMIAKKHLKPEGLKTIVAIRASSNWGLPKDLRKAFPNIEREKPVIAKQLPDGNWIAGFVSGEGSFLVYINETKGDACAMLRNSISNIFN